MTKTYADLFAGIGGFHQAAKELGLKCAFTSEIDEAARATYLANHDTPMMNEDIRALTLADLPDFDFLFAGFPCQPFSQAGFKRGFNDERGNLFFNIYKILEAKRPTGFFLENVRGLLKHDNGRTLAVIKEALLSLGYSVEYKVIFAKDFGVPQLRPRLFIIGNRVGAKYEWPEPIELQKTLNDILGGECPRDIGFTLRVGGRGSPINGRHNWDGYWVNGEARRLTVEQSAALQGFPKGFSFPGSKAQAMKQLGNSVAVPAIKAHLRALVEATS